MRANTGREGAGRAARGAGTPAAGAAPRRRPSRARSAGAPALPFPAVPGEAGNPALRSLHRRPPRGPGPRRRPPPPPPARAPPRSRPRPRCRPPRLTCTCSRERSRPAAPQEKRQQEDEPERAPGSEGRRAADPPPPGTPAEPPALLHALRSRPEARRRTRVWRFSASPASPRGSRCPPPPRRGCPRHRAPRPSQSPAGPCGRRRRHLPGYLSGRGWSALLTDSAMRQSTRASPSGGGIAGRDGANP